MNALQKDIQDAVARHIALSPHKLPQLIEALAFDAPIGLRAPNSVVNDDRFVNLGKDGRPTTGEYIAIYDQETGLTWAAAPLPSGTHPQVTASAKALSLLGFTDWQVSSIKQLIGGPVDYTRYNPVLDKKHFGQWPSECVWTSTPDCNPDSAASCAFVVVLGGGYSLRGLQDDLFQALAVVAGQPK